MHDPIAYDPCPWCAARAFGIPCPKHGPNYQTTTADETTDYSKSKFQDALTESAYAVAGDGFAEDTSGDLSDGVDWSALVVVDGKHVIIREDVQGFVWTDYAEDWHGVGRCSIQRAWDRIVTEDAVRLAGDDF